MKPFILLSAVVIHSVFFVAPHAHGAPDRDTAEEMRLLVVETLISMGVKGERREKALKAWQTAIERAVNNVELQTLSARKTERLLKDFSVYVRAGDTSHVSEERTRQWESQIKKGLQYAIADKPLLTEEERGKIAKRMENYMTSFSTLLLESLRDVKELAVETPAWARIEKAYQDLAFSGTMMGGYSMSSGQKKICQEFTTENEQLRWDYARLYIYTRAMALVCARVQRNRIRLNNVFMRHLYVEPLSPQQKHAVIEGDIDIDRIIRQQISTLIRQDTFYYKTSAVNFVGYWSAVLMPEERLGQSKIDDYQKDRNWVRISRNR